MVVTGYHLDNAMGNEPYNNCGEFLVGIKREGWNREIEWFNLATLIALARIGAHALAHRSIESELLEACEGLIETIEEWYVNSDGEIASFLEPYKAAIAKATSQGGEASE